MKPIKTLAHMYSLPIEKITILDKTIIRKTNRFGVDALDPYHECYIANFIIENYGHEYKHNTLNHVPESTLVTDMLLLSKFILVEQMIGLIHRSEVSYNTNQRLWRIYVNTYQLWQPISIQNTNFARDSIKSPDMKNLLLNPTPKIAYSMLLKYNQHVQL